MKNADMTLGPSLFVIFLCLLFGGNGVAMKFGYTGLGPFTSAGLRFSLAASLLVIWARYKAIPLRLDREQRRLIIPQSFLFVIQVSGFHLGLNHTTASHAALVANVLPFMVLILAHFFIPGDRITPKKSIGIIMGFIGVVVLFFDKTDLGTAVQSGDIIVLTAVLCWSVSAVYVKRIIHRFNAVQMTLYPMIFGIPFFFLGGWLWDTTMVAGVTPTVVKAILYQGTATAAFGFVAWNTMLQRYGATALHSFVFIVPLAGVSFGVLLLGEPVTSHLLTAIVCIVAGIIVVNYRKRKKPPILPPHRPPFN
ncbi:MAG TPA: EamA/RhaT family transporter [Desulfobacteraceae bacterium]|nr:EamA/RhaT family transporter [Desulfobacteraceae bacterium]|tara:strand:- start:793 stop:1716 length:924 start_codon:yes stop_codon:yes gene_type:complete